MIVLTDENFEKEILNSPKPILVDFYAVWCFPCSVLAPILEKLETEYGEKIIFARVDVDNSPITAQRFGINPIPAVILFKGGKPAGEFVGVRPEPAIKEWLESLLKNNNDEYENKEKTETLIQEYGEYARRNGFSLNPDRKTTEGIVKGLLEREKKFGARYCPCRRVTGNKEDDKKIICPCFYHRQEIEKDGHCFCGLFVKPN